jgi:hypothetical protein
MLGQPRPDLVPKRDILVREPKIHLILLIRNGGGVVT